MNGIDNIVSAIIASAEQKAADITENAERSANQMIEAAEKQAKEQSDEILSEAGKKAEAIKESAESFGALDQKNALLKAKMQLINEVFSAAVKKLCTLPDDEYFHILGRLIAANAVSGDGVLVLNSKDIERMPSGFMSLVGSSVANKGAITLCTQADNSIVGGCILKYGDIEMDLCFERIIMSNKEQLVDRVNSVLFC